MTAKEKVRAYLDSFPGAPYLHVGPLYGKLRVQFPQYGDGLLRSVLYEWVREHSKVAS